MKKVNKVILLVFLIIIVLLPTTAILAQSGVSAQDLINLITSWRAAVGNAPLTIDPLLNTTAYDTALTMAIQKLDWHIGNVSGRVESYGYGDGSKVWCTENFAMSYSGASIDKIAVWWDDPDHRLPATLPYYKHVGAGVATYDGVTYYVLHACYTSAGNYTPGDTYTASDSTDPESGSISNPTNAVSQIIVPITTSTPQANGSVYHIVQAGQSLWSIAIEYGTKIETIKELNNLYSNDIYLDQELLIFPAGSQPTHTTQPQSTSTAPAPAIQPTFTVQVQEETDPQSSPTPQALQHEEQSQSRSPLSMVMLIGIGMVALSAIGLVATLLFERFRKP